jgi:hypothetical protein
MQYENATRKLHELIEVCAGDHFILNEESYRRAGDILKVLSEKTEWLENLTLSATPQGEVVLRWKNPERGTFAMIVDAIGTLHYARITNEEELSGKMAFEVTQHIPNFIKKVSMLSLPKHECSIKLNCGSE